VTSPSPKTPGTDAIRLGDANERDHRKPVRYSLLLLVFMRVVAFEWLLRGLLRWFDLLSLHVANPGEASTALSPREAFFCVADIVAGVGLWLGSAWGGVLWLFTDVVGMLATLASPGAGAGPHIVFGADFVLVVAYFVLTWYAARERAGDN
jgi:hypothetical protein